MGDGIISIESFRATPDRRVPKQRPGKRRAPWRPRRPLFIKGPLPVAWFCRACDLGKQAARVGVALWFQRGIGANRDVVRINAQLRERFNITSDCAHRGLRALVSGGLVRVVRGGRGRCAVVEILTDEASA